MIALASLRGPAVIVAFALALVVAAGPGCGSAARTGPAHPVAVQVEAVDGGVINTRAYRGRPVVLHLFTTWSLAAQQDVTQLVAAVERYGERIQIVGIALDPDGYRLVAPWRRVNRVPYLVGLGTEELISGRSALGEIGEVPTTVILGANGVIAHRVTGPLAAGELARLVDSILAQK